jgi:hypothetical protein
MVNQSKNKERERTNARPAPFFLLSNVYAPKGAINYLYDKAFQRIRQGIF